MSNQKHSGMTLVELMAALAIMSVLMVAATSSLAKLSKWRSEDTRLPSRWAEMSNRLQSLLTLDLGHGKRWRSVPGGFEVTGQMCLDDKSLEVNHMPAQIAYVVRPCGDHNWLVRTQALTGRKKAGELVCPSIRSIELRSKALGPGEWKPLDETVVISIEADIGGELRRLEFSCETSQ